ncbi:MAG TPA: hypothetical protein ENI20_12070, partial [Bacteroides sp.]|nr:hypothetical protein [Bacteroides sp.]
MNKYFKIAFLILGYLFSPSLSEAQGPVISGDFTDLSFKEFVRKVEDQVPVRFIYLEIWMQDISVSVRGDNLDLMEVLSDQFRGTELNFQIDTDNRIFITRGMHMVLDLPDYENSSIKASMGKEGANVLTNTEKLYIEGRKAVIVSTLIIGNEKDLGNRDEAVINGELKDAENGEPL